MIHYMEDLQSSEMLFVKSGLQVIIFGTGSLARKYLRSHGYLKQEDERKQGVDQDGCNHDKYTESNNHGWKFYVTIGLANLGLAISQYLVFIAFKLLPVSDLMVFCFSTPILDLFLSACILRCAKPKQSK